MPDQEKMTHDESLRIIAQMINAAKQEQKDSGVGWIIWGWLLFAASVLTYLNLENRWFNTFFFWNSFGIISLVLLAYETFCYIFIYKKQRVKTYTADLFRKLNMGFVICLMLIILSMNVHLDENQTVVIPAVSPSKGFSLLLGLYGFWVLIYGAALNFRPSIIGAYLIWGAAFAGLFVTDFRWTMVLHAAAVLVGYIIPGHIAYREFKKVSRK